MLQGIIHFYAHRIMSQLSFVIPLMEDETLYSYLLRLAKVNGFEDIRHFTDSHVFSSRYENKGKKYVDVSFDIRDDLYRFAVSLQGSQHVQVLPFYLRTSIFSGIAPFMLRANASRYVGLLSKYHNHSRILAHAELMIQSLNLCPQCQADDIQANGFFYYRRAHQMPGVTVCHKHGCALQRYTGKHGEEMAEYLPTVELATHDMSTDYAIFCKDLLDGDLTCDRLTIADAIAIRMEEVKNTTGEDPFVNWNNGYNRLAEKTPTEMIHYIRQKDMVHLPSLITLLLYLFDSVSNLKLYLKPTFSLQKSCMETADEQYSLVSAWREDLIEMKCLTCDTYFITTPYRLISGWGCPSCDGHVDEQTLFRRLFEKAGGDEYQLMSDFQSMGQKIHIKHTPCGKEYDVSAKDFIEYGVKCSCNYALQEQIVRKKMKELGFELRAFRSTTQPMTLYHQACDGTFEARYHMFLKTPHCRICDRRKADIAKPHEVFLRNVEDLVGDEYTVLEQYSTAKEPISIRHNRCKTVQKYAPKHFINGQRCKSCQRRISDQDFARIVSEVSCGRYACVDRMPPNKVVIRDTETETEKTMTAQRALQELFRPTPSPILPLEKRNLNVEMPRNQKDIIMEHLEKHYHPGEIIDTRELKVDGLMRSSVTNGMGELAAEGRLIRTGVGCYTLLSMPKAA